LLLRERLERPNASACVRARDARLLLRRPRARFLLIGTFREGRLADHFSDVSPEQGDQPRGEPLARGVRGPLVLDDPRVVSLLRAAHGQKRPLTTHPPPRRPAAAEQSRRPPDPAAY